MIPTTAQYVDLLRWQRLPERLDRLVDKHAMHVLDLREAVGDLWTLQPVGYHYHAGEQKLAVHAPRSDATELRLCKSAAARVAPVREEPLSDAEASGAWVKIAYSPTLRRGGELLNFFPGKYPGGIPNSPGPVQSMLTSGLVGAGLGYGAGYLAEQVLPASWKKKRLRRTLAVLGGLGGVAPGALWAYTNARQGLPLNDPRTLDTQAPMPKAAGDELADIELGERWLAAARAAAGQFRAGHAELYKAAGTMDGPGQPRQRHRFDVNVDTMGRTLWETGADPDVAGTTMGVLHAAERMPGGERPGWVTPSQMGYLGANMGAGYASGALVGAALGTLTGMPESAQSVLRRSGMYVGLVRAVVPQLFGG